MSPVQIALMLLDGLLTGLSLIQAIDRAAHGIAAKAELEGREVTPAEQELIRQLRDESAKRRRGE
jgi:hypothetical protein